MSTATAIRPTPPPLRAPEVRRPSLVQLTAVELRKTLDTRAGRWLLGVMGVLAAAGLAYRLWHAPDGPITFEDFNSTALFPVQLLLPVLGVLALTSEWTQRTALTTFTLVPQRGRVVTAKLAAALVVTAAVVLVVAVVSALGAAAAGLGTGDPVHWGDVGDVLGGAAAGAALSMLAGAGFGALLQQTPAALAMYFVAPALVGTAARAMLHEGAEWVDVSGALGRVFALDLTGAVAPTLVALGLWIVLPLAAGTVRTLRREVS
jgi:hypothetical protein